MSGTVRQCCSPTRRSDRAVDVADRPVEQRGGTSDRFARPPGARRARVTGPAPAPGRLRWPLRRRSAAPAESRVDRSSTPPRRCGAGRVRRPGRASPILPGRRPAAMSRRPPPTPAASEPRRRAAPGPARPAPGRGGPGSPRTPGSSASDAPAPTSGPSMLVEPVPLNDPQTTPGSADARYSSSMARLSPSRVGLRSRCGARCGVVAAEHGEQRQHRRARVRSDLPDRSLETDARALAVHDPLHQIHVALPVPAVPTRGAHRHREAVPGLPGAQHRRREPGARGQLTNREAALRAAPSGTDHLWMINLNTLFNSGIGSLHARARVRNRPRTLHWGRPVARQRASARGG